MSRAAAVVVLTVFLLMPRGPIEPAMHIERDWTVLDLPGGIPLSNEIILENSWKRVQEEPANEELRSKTVDFARMLASPQAPPKLAWEILIREGVLKDGMTLLEADRILGNPTKTTETGSWWYFNFRGQHVFPGLEATVSDGRLSGWRIGRF